MFRVSVALLAALPAILMSATDAVAQGYKGKGAPAGFSNPSPAVRPVAPPTTNVVRPEIAFIVVPVGRAALTGPALSLAPDEPRRATLQPTAPHAPEIRPLSVNVVDPFTVVSRSPSGSVVLTSLRPGYRYRGHRQQARAPLNYAPPSFQIIGSPNIRHMAQPVKLIHGVKPRRGLRTEPKVVFLKDAR
jgi:hypothetical protein